MHLPMTETSFHTLLAWGVMGIAALVFGLLLLISAPYGRHARSGWGPTMSTRWAWVVMESPSVLAFLAIYLAGGQRLAVTPLVLLALWQLHYINRTFVYPFRIRADGKRTAIMVVVMGMVFNTINAYLNARQLSHFGVYETAWLTDPRFIVGVLVFFVGRHINTRADAMLLALRAEGGGYRIPRGWLYERISCPNYFGEVLQWCGFAIASWSLAGASFAIFTFANLVPRAISNHRWYHEKFDDYPAERRAWLPYIW